MYADISCSNAHDSGQRLQRAEGCVRMTLHRRHGETRLSQLYQSGCAKLRLPAKLVPSSPQEAILINTAGGLTGGDRIETEIAVNAGAAGIVTTQACERIYRSTGDTAHVSTRLRIEPDGWLAWLPQETILFNEARLSRSLEVDLSGNAEFLAVEAVLFGRKAMNETVRFGSFRDRWRIRRDGRLVFADDICLEGEIDAQIERACILGGGMAMATLLLIGNEPESLIDGVRDSLGAYGGASAFNGKLVARIIAPDSLTLRRALEPALSILLRGRTLPKVWQL